MAEVVLVNRYGWTAKPAWVGARPEARYLSMGDEITADTFADSNIGAENELKRGRDLGAIGDPEVLRRLAAAQEPVAGVTALNDAELVGMDVETAAAHVTQYPGDLDRLIRLEVLKGAKARKGILELANLAPVTTELTEAEAAERAAAEAAASGT